MDKFLLSENPMRPDHGLFILHRFFPECLIEAICLNDKEMDGSLSAIFDLFSFHNSDGIVEQYQLIVRDYYAHDDADSVPDDDVPRYRDMLKKAWRWYRSYLEFEDGNIDMDEYGKHN